MTRMKVVRHPFPHVVVDGHWDRDLLRDVAREFPDVGDSRWRRYTGKTELKLEGPPHMWGPRTREMLEEMSALAPKLGEAFGIDGLVMETIGGGYHYIEPGGYLGIHTDFNRSPVTNMFRRLNLLVYLNEDWKDEGGHLELWDGDGVAVKVAPEMNRTVAFETSDTSWHGHPMPANRARRSVAAYFFTKEAPVGYASDHSTLWHPLSGGAAPSEPLLSRKDLRDRRRR